MSEPEFSSAAVYRIFKKAGAERVSDDAVMELSKFFELYGERVAQQAAALAQHAGRKTVKASDVKLAIKNIFNIEV